MRYFIKKLISYFFKDLIFTLTSIVLIILFIVFIFPFLGDNAWNMTAIYIVIVFIFF